jgi:hypothetical protein
MSRVSRRTRSLTRGYPAPTPAQPFPVALPTLAHFLLARAKVVDRGRERQGTLHPHEHDRPDLVYDRRVERTEGWEQLELLCVHDEQVEYERIGPLVLFGESDRQRTGRNRDSLPMTPPSSRTEASIEPGTVHVARSNTSAATASRRNADGKPNE